VETLAFGYSPREAEGAPKPQPSMKTWQPENGAGSAVEGKWVWKLKEEEKAPARALAGAIFLIVWVSTADGVSERKRLLVYVDP